jgi:DNA-binding protein H-NS
MSSYRDVKAQIAKLEKQAADLFKKEVADVIAKVKGLVKEYGLTAADLGLAGKAVITRTRKSAPKPAGVAKYRDPISNKTWTGHGKAPRFITEAVAAGKSRDDFLIEKKASVVAKKVTKAAKPAAKKVVKKSLAGKKSAKTAVLTPAEKSEEVAISVVEGAIST